MSDAGKAALNLFPATTVSDVNVSTLQNSEDVTGSVDEDGYKSITSSTADSGVASVLSETAAAAVAPS